MYRVHVRFNVVRAMYYNSELLFYEPSSFSDISRLLESYSPLPDDYLKFLSITNGFRPFSEVPITGETEIFSIDEVLEINKHYDHPSMIMIACTNDDYLILDTKDVAQGMSEYMYVIEGGGCPFEFARSLYCDFQTWLDRFCMAQGNKYWTWRVEDRKI